MALGNAGVSEAFTLHGDKLPLVALRAQGELEDTVDAVGAHLAVGDRGRDRGLASAASGAHYELADALLGVCPPLRVLRGEALVVVLVAGEDHVGVRLIERLPQLLHPPGSGAMFLPGAEAWMVHISEGAPRLVVGSEVLLEPPRLGGTRATADLLAVAVEGYHVPGPELVGVVSSLGVACGLTEVLKVASGPFGVVLVVAGDGLGAPLEPSPRRLVAFLEVRGRAPRLGPIPQDQARPIYALDH